MCEFVGWMGGCGVGLVLADDEEEESGAWTTRQRSD